MVNHPSDRPHVDIDDAWVLIAERLVQARRLALALPDYPGVQPKTLEQGYRVQDRAIELWSQPVAGWKVGKVPDAWERELRADRLVGPIFEGAVQHVPGGQQGRFAAIRGGFSAIEAEYVFRLGADAPAEKTDYDVVSAAVLADALCIGMELAGSPLPFINALGPPVVVSDFGNNTGLIVGPQIGGWRDLAQEDLVCETFIDGLSVGRGGGANLAGGPLAALAFALNCCARRGHPLRKGMYVTTGATTGIHDILAGQLGRVDFGPHGALECSVVLAQPQRGHAR
ncbi:2-keto-4-pentenoate hydratase [Lysobacter sp. K5869]|uniref:2-keto-4-pentenoate hydratase n=1 Tax=Lysobacter sp. K5869 TaxID=2820808 RepID=UPI001C05FAC8|nr:2-keto-4-pentenoate hydratase [Lysobacter sp. K5869]QWP75285.1 2-keto-4-pentenoate hydratase [Lysobacter sp. K5869]